MISPTCDHYQVDGQMSGVAIRDPNHGWEVYATNALQAPWLRPLETVGDSIVWSFPYVLLMLCIVLLSIYQPFLLLCSSNSTINITNIYSMSNLTVNHAIFWGAQFWFLPTIRAMPVLPAGFFQVSNLIWGWNLPNTHHNTPYGYGSIPINTIFSGMNIHLPAILMFTRGTRFWPIPICFPFNLALLTLALTRRNHRCQPSRIRQKISWPRFGEMDTSSFRGFWRMRLGWSWPLITKRSSHVSGAVHGLYGTSSLGNTWKNKGPGPELKRRLNWNEEFYQAT